MRCWRGATVWCTWAWASSRRSTTPRGLLWWRGPAAPAPTSPTPNLRLPCGARAGRKRRTRCEGGSGRPEAERACPLQTRHMLLVHICEWRACLHACSNRPCISSHRRRALHGNAKRRRHPALSTPRSKKGRPQQAEAEDAAAAAGEQAGTGDSSGQGHAAAGEQGEGAQGSGGGGRCWLRQRKRAELGKADQ